MKGALLLLFALFALSVSASTLKLKGTLECGLCEFVVSTAEKYVAQNATVDDIIKYLDEACALLPKNWGSDCETMVNDYAPEIIQKLINDESPDQICSDLTLCSNSSSTVQKADEKVSGAVDCGICKWVVGEAEKYVAENATESEIVTEIEKACDIFKGFKTACDGIVSTYVPQIVQMLENKETPDQICADLTLCSNTTVAIVPLPQGDGDCGTCKLIVSAAENYISQNKTENDTLAFLEKDCEFLPDKNWVTTCKGAIATYGPQIFQLVLNKETPSVICAQIGFCTPNNSRTAIKINDAPAVIPSKIAAADNLTCDICQFLVKIVENYVAANKTETEIVTELTTICSIIPDKSIASACSSMVSEYGDLIIQYLVNEEPPEVVCPEVKLCPPSATFSFKAFDIKKLFL